MIQKKYKTIDQCHQFLQQQNNQANSNENISIPFLQHFNTWRNLETVREFVTSPLMADMARTLLDVPSIKLYQDSLFHKRQNDGPTPWHSDARMAPFDTSHMITFWIPLQNIPSVEEGGSGLMFVDKSHGDFALPFWNRVPKGDVGNGEDYDCKTGKVKYEESREYERLDERYSYGSGNDGVSSYMPMERGDCTVHAGWTLHSANGVKCETDRYALAVTYVDAQAEIREDARMSSGSLGHDEDRKSYEDWINEVRPRTYFEHSLVPII
uniref:Phytanoyl-CoA dioxygenase n=1 Tax=Chaetoceros debilis TaxID=122233 RepID=A0A7S3PZC3_9STRA